MRSQHNFLILNSLDNVMTLIKNCKAGESVNGLKLISSKALTLGDKIALKDLKVGEKVIKYGLPIGLISQQVKRGEWVHTHNLKSDYLPTYELGENTQL